MNELDWWIASQWEMFKIKEGKTGLEFNKTDKEGNVLTVDRTQKWNKLRAKTDLKEMYIVTCIRMRTLSTTSVSCILMI